jgi:hypothetical protein
LSEFRLNNSTDDVDLKVYEFPKKGTITIINGATGTEF